VQLGLLCSKYDHRRRTLLEARKLQAASLDGGETLTFLADPSDPAKDPSWKCAPVPADIQDRRVEITG
jgi:malate synthase